MTQVLSIRLDDELFRSLREIPEHQEMIKRYTEFLADTHGKITRSIDKFLDTYLGGKEVTSPVYRFIHLIATARYIKRWDYSRTIELYDDLTSEAKLVADTIINEWFEIREKNIYHSSMVQEELKATLYNRTQYQQFLAWMRKNVKEMTEQNPDFWYIISDLLYQKDDGKSEYLIIYEEMLEDMKIILNPLFGKGTIDGWVKQLINSGAAQRYYHDARKNQWDSIEINRHALDEIRFYRESKITEIQERLAASLNDELFEILKGYFNSRVTEPYEKENGFEGKNPDEIKTVILNNWITFRNKYTHLSPTAIDVVKSFALKKV